ncbi:MAG TPA: phosphatidylserine/phosphatidylglycerophosphate/cardiolipin synthase family protein [Verrucomicrobiales bacterium]|jgi:cardiolipin synthase|nr:phosphatidylserine/phosphatidylglycerophosphate/cardiolipin synthase family protein [Verrucomicrobiales bacterium]
MSKPLPFVALAAVLTPLLFTRCASPKMLNRLDENRSTQPAILSHLGHVWRATAVSFARAPVSTARSGVAVAVHRTRAFLSGSIPLPAIKPNTSGTPAPGTEDFERFLDQHRLPARTSGKVKLLVDGRRFFPDFIREAKKAKVSIDTQSFIFDNDDFGVGMADLLKQRAEEISVRVVFDSIGTRSAHKVEPETKPPAGFTPPAYMGKYLKKDHSHIGLRTTSNPFLLCDHTKIHVIDHRIGYTGGMNFGREYKSEWHDLMARLEGPVVSELQAVFDDHWNRESWVRNWTFGNSRHTQPASTGEPPPAESIPLRVLRTDSSRATYQIVRAFRAAIAGARQRVWVHTPYLAEEGIIADLIAATRRGVQVRVIVPGKNDSGFMEKVNYQAADKLVKAGASVFAYPGMTHLKVVICDQWGMFGSANCDTLSLKLNRELNLASSAPALVRDLERQVFLPDFKVSRPITAAMTEEKKSPLADAAGNQL